MELEVYSPIHLVWIICLSYHVLMMLNVLRLATMLSGLLP
jgi:hypothetical protein